MRQYRGLTRDGEWVYGWYFYEELNDKHYILVKPSLLADYRFDAIVGHIEVIPETVGQYIGLKDKNSTEIYKGDIVEFNVVNMIWDEEKHEVKEHRPETWRRVVEWIAPKFIKHWYPEKMKIIGNIYENPKLLEEKQ